MPRGDHADLAVAARWELTFARERLRDRLPLGDDLEAGQERHRILSSVPRDLRTIVIAPAHDEPVASVVKTIGAILKVLGRSGEKQIARTGDRAAMAEAVASAGPLVIMNLVDLQITGSAPRVLLQKALGENGRPWVSCYRAARGRGSVDFPLEVQVDFTLGSSGTATDIETAGPASAALVTCLEAVLAKLELPPPERGKATVKAKMLFEAPISPH